MLRKFASVLVVGSALLLGACGQPAAEAPSSGSHKIAVGTIAVAGDAPVALALDKGIFAKHGLDVTLRPGQNFGAVLPLVQNGELQIGFSSAIPLINASTRGANIQVFATQEYTDSEADTATIAVMVPNGSSLKSPKDLEGKNVGVVAKGNSDALALFAAIKKDGGDPAKVNLLELGIGPQLLQGLEVGNVDAIVGGEPTMSRATAAGNEVMFYPMVEGMPGLPQGGYFATEAYAKSNADALRKFTAAINEASEYARENPEEIRALLPEFLSIDQETAQKVRLPRWDTTFKPEDWQKLADLGAEFGLVPPNTQVESVREP